MSIRSFLCVLTLFVSGIANAALSSAPTSPALLVKESVSASGTVAMTGQVGGIGFGDGGFGIGSSATALDVSVLAVPTPNFGSSPTRDSILNAAIVWAAASAAQLRTSLGGYMSQSGLSSAWFMYEQTITVPSALGPTSQRLTWSLSQDAGGRVSYGVPRLEPVGQTDVRVLQVEYQARPNSEVIDPAYVNAFAGKIRYRVLDGSLTAITADQEIDVAGAFDPPTGSSVSNTDAINCLVSSGNAGCSAAATDVKRLLAETGSSFAIVDYTSAWGYEYVKASDSFCPNGSAAAGSCFAARTSFTFSTRTIDMDYCGTKATYRTAGTYALGLQRITDRFLVDSADSSANAVQQFKKTDQQSANFDSGAITITSLEASAIYSGSDTRVWNPFESDPAKQSLIDSAILGTVNFAGAVNRTGETVCDALVATVSPSTLNVANSGVFTASVTGGHGPYIYQWSGVDYVGGTISIGSPSSRSTTLSRSGPDLGVTGGTVGHAVVTVTDQVGTQASATVTLVIDPVPPLEIVLDSSKATWSSKYGMWGVYGTCSSKNRTCSATTSASPLRAQGGTGRYNFNWSSSDGDAASVMRSNAADTTFARNASGTQDARYKLTVFDGQQTASREIAVQTVHIQEPSITLEPAYIRTIHFAEAWVEIGGAGRYSTNKGSGNWLDPVSYAADFEVYAQGYNLGGTGNVGTVSPLNRWLPLGGTQRYEWFTNRAEAEGPGAWAGWVELTFRRKSTGETWGPIHFELISEGNCVMYMGGCTQLLP